MTSRSHRGRVTRRRLARLAAAALVVAVFGVLLVTGLGQFDGADDDGASSSTTVFTMESEDGTLTLDADADPVADGGGAAVEFEGQDPEGNDLEGFFSFDLDGDGSVTQGQGGSFELTAALPRGWPADFPLPADAELLRGSIINSEALVQRSATFRTAPSAEETVGWYRTVLTEAGADVVVGAGEAQDGAAATLSFEGPWTGFVTVVQGELVTELGVQLFGEAG